MACLKLKLRNARSIFVRNCYEFETAVEKGREHVNTPQGCLPEDDMDTDRSLFQSQALSTCMHKLIS